LRTKRPDTVVIIINPVVLYVVTLLDTSRLCSCNGISARFQFDGAPYILRQCAPELDMGRVHPRVVLLSGQVGLSRVQISSLLSGSGRVGSICVGLCGSLWIIQNVTLSVIVKFTQFS